LWVNDQFDVESEEHRVVPSIPSNMRVSEDIRGIA
jgi:hypothetical protein